MVRWGRWWLMWVRSGGNGENTGRKSLLTARGAIGILAGEAGATQMATQQNTELHDIVDGRLNRAWRLLGEGLGPYTARKIGDPGLLATRDVSLILRKMTSGTIWRDHFSDLGYSARSWASELRDARNTRWGHQGSYNNDDVHHYLGVMVRLLSAAGANEQANVISEMRNEVGHALYGVANAISAQSYQISSDYVVIGKQDLEEFVRSTIPELAKEVRLQSALPNTLPEAQPGIAVGSGDTEQQPANAEVSAHRERGIGHIRESRFDEAIDSFIKVVALDPNNPRNYLARGYAYTWK